MEFDVFEIWRAMGPAVKGVVVVLCIQTLVSILVTVDRLILLTTTQFRSRRFAREVGPLLAAGNRAGTLALMKQFAGTHLADHLRTGFETFVDRSALGHEPQRAAEFALRALERKSEAMSADLNRGMNVLASTGSTAPFVGLLGTVLGILNTFKMLAAEGSGNINAIGPSIAEALIVTGLGLMIAIPSVLLFNFLSARIAAFETNLANAGRELVDRLEAGVIVLREGSVESPAAGISTTAAAAA